MEDKITKQYILFFEHPRSQLSKAYCFSFLCYICIDYTFDIGIYPRFTMKEIKITIQDPKKTFCIRRSFFNFYSKMLYSFPFTVTSVWGDNIIIIQHLQYFHYKTIEIIYFWFNLNHIFKYDLKCAFFQITLFEYIYESGNICRVKYKIIPKQVFHECWIFFSSNNYFYLFQLLRKKLLSDTTFLYYIF